MFTPLYTTLFKTLTNPHMSKELLLDIVMRLSSRKFIAFVVVAFIIFADNFGLNVDAEIRKQLMIMALGYITVEGTADAVRAYKES